MAKKEYTVVTRLREAQPRSKRLRNAGNGSSSASGGSGNITVNGGETHSHSNKATLDAQSMDDDGYLYLRHRNDDADESITEKVKAGYADDAAHAAEADNADRWDDAEFKDYIDQALRKGDIVEFLKVLATELRTKNFAPGIETGTGALIDNDGNAEMTSLILRSFLKVPQLIYNKVSVTGGEMWNTEGGTIASVTKDSDSDTAYILTMEVEDGDSIGLAVDDICKGHYNSNGGFITSYFRVTAINQSAKTVRIVLGAESEVPGGVNCPPVAYMNIARYGNFTDTARQRSQYFSSSEQRIVLLDGVDNYIIEPKHYKVVIGSVPESLLPKNNPVSGKASIYLDNVLARNFFQIDARGDIVRTIRDRGLWSATDAADSPYLNNAQYQDEVYHNSCKYRCITEGTTAEPQYDSTDWLLVAGDTTLRLDIESSDGETFLYGQLSTTLTAEVYRGVNDITAEISAGDWKWTRETGDVASDTIWNVDHASYGNSVALTNEDLNVSSGKFVCTAYVRDGATRKSLQAEVSF